ncbi:MAG: glycosyltransferase family 2 protein [Anaerolineales bacterium]
MVTAAPGLRRTRTPMSDGGGADDAVALSVVVASWNVREALRDCLLSVEGEIARLAPARVEVVVVDNASSDGSQAMVAAEFPWVMLIRNAGNAGFARASNQGIDAAHGPLLLLLNPDTLVIPGALATLMRFMREHAEAGAAGACLVNPDGSLQASAHPSPGLLREFWRLFNLDSLMRLSTYPLERWGAEPRRVDVAQGACLALRREALDQVGALDENFFMYTEEVDLCRRLWHAGWTVHWVPEARVVHLGGQSTMQLREEMFLRLYESKVRFFRKHRGRMAVAAYKFLLVLASLPRILVGVVVVVLPGARWDRSLAPNYLRLLTALPRF